MTSTALDQPLPPGTSAQAERRRRLIGIGYICLALLIFTGLDASAKWLGKDLPVMQIAFVRYFGAFTLVALVQNPWRRPRAWATPRLWLQILRGLMLLGSTIANFYAVQYLQLAETMAINFSLPFLVALAAGPILGERIGPRQWLAISIGFIGVLVITQPGSGAFNPAIALSIASVLCNVVYSITTRSLAAVASTSSMLLISAGIPTLLLAPIMPAIWVWPGTWLQWADFALIGLCGYVGHYFLIRAYALAPAPVVAPFTYTQIVWMALTGYLLFGDIPGFNTIIGASIIIASGLYLLVEEARSSKRLRTA